MAKRRTRRGSPFDKLPVHIAASIVSFLDEDDRFADLPYFNRYFANVCNHPLSWPPMCAIHGRAIQNKWIPPLKSLETATSMRSLKIDTVDCKGKRLQAVNALPSLRDLRIVQIALKWDEKERWYSPVPFWHFIDAGVLPKLESFSLGSSHPAINGHDARTTDMPYIAKMTNLTSLTIHEWQRGVSTEDMWVTISQLPKLRCLQLRNLHGLHRHRKLVLPTCTELHLSWLLLGHTEDATAMWNVFPNLERLRANVEAGVEMARLFDNVPKSLRVLDMPETKDVGTMILPTEQLTSLSIGTFRDYFNNVHWAEDVDDKIAPATVSLFPRLTTLYIEVAHHSMFMEGRKSPSQAMRMFPALTDLTIRETGSAHNQPCTFLEAFPRLQRLNVGCTRPRGVTTWFKDILPSITGAKNRHADSIAGAKHLRSLSLYVSDRITECGEWLLPALHAHPTLEYFEFESLHGSRDVMIKEMTRDGRWAQCGIYGFKRRRG